MKKIIILVLLTGFLGFLHTAYASEAGLYLLTERKNFEAGETFYADVKVKTDEVLINAAQATVRFPKGILELKEADKTGSVFVFWIDEPTISNEEGTLKFMGGTSKNVAGDSLQILRLKFKVVGIGQADITVSDAVVTAGDGKGTNVLSSIEGTTVLVGPKVIQPSIPAPVPAFKSSAPEPQKVERAPVLSEKLPQKPKLEIPPYSVASIAGIDINLRELAYIFLAVLIGGVVYFWRSWRREASYYRATIKKLEETIKKLR